MSVVYNNEGSKIMRFVLHDRSVSMLELHTRTSNPFFKVLVNNQICVIFLKLGDGCVV